MSFSAKSLGSFLLVITPAVSLLSANLHFQLIAGATNLFPASIFTLQDHFDKAVDLLIPVFVTYILATCIGVAYADSTGSTSETDLPENDVQALAEALKKEKRSRFRSNLRIFVFTLLWILFMAGPLTWLAGYGILLLIMSPLVKFLTDVAERTLKWDHENTYLRIAFATFLVGAVSIGIGFTASSELTRATSKHWDTREEVIIDRFGPNYFVVREGRYYLVDETGSPIFMGDKVPDRIESVACQYVGGWTCWNSRSLDDREERAT